MYPIHVHMRCLYYLNIVPLHMVGNFHKLLPRVAFVCRVFSINKAVIIEKKHMELEICDGYEVNGSLVAETDGGCICHMLYACIGGCQCLS